MCIEAPAVRSPPQFLTSGSAGLPSGSMSAWEQQTESRLAELGRRAHRYRWPDSGRLPAFKVRYRYYRLIFDTQGYFQHHGQRCFYSLG